MAQPDPPNRMVGKEEHLTKMLFRSKAFFSSRVQHAHIQKLGEELKATWDTQWEESWAADATTCRAVQRENEELRAEVERLRAERREDAERIRYRESAQSAETAAERKRRKKEGRRAREATGLAGRR